MASFVLKNAYVSYGGTDITNYVQQVTFNAEAEAPDDTAMGDTWRSIVSGGLKVAGIDISAWNDATLDAVLWPLLGTSAAFEVRPTTAAATTSNPKWTGVAIMTAYTPITGTAGDLATSPFTATSKGTVTRATA